MLAALESGDYSTVPASNDNPRPSEPLADVVARVKAARTAAAVEPCPVPVLASTAVRAPRPPASFPKTAGARPCTSFERDRRILKKMEALSEVEGGVIAANDAAPLVEDPSTSTLTSRPASKSAEKRRRADESDKRKAPAWERTTDVLKGYYVFENISTRGAGLSWTLNLGRDVIQAANDDPAGWRAWMHDRLAKTLGKFLGPRDFAWEPEFTFGGRLHIHGVIDATDDERVQVEAALCRAGGTWGHTHGKEHQALAEVMWGAAGWARYTAKAAAVARRFFGCKSVLSATRDARRRARAAYEAEKAVYEARQRPLAVEAPQPAPEAAVPVSEPQDDATPASPTRSRRRSGSPAVARAPLPIPAIVIRVAPAVPIAPWIARPQLGALAVQVAPIAAVSPPLRPAAARSRGPPAVSELPVGTAGQDIPPREDQSILTDLKNVPHMRPLSDENRSAINTRPCLH